MFEDEELAANVPEEESEQPASPVPPTSPVDETKAFAKRLKEETAKIREQDRQEIAESMGYENWSAFVEAQKNNKFLDKGLDPEVVKPLIKDFMHEDPDYIEAMKYKAEKEELEKEIFAKSAIDALNSRYGTSYKSVNELDEETINMWNNGTPLEKAFAANHIEELQNMAVKKAQRESGKEHLKQVSGGSPKEPAIDVTAAEIAAAKMFGFTEEQLREHKNRK